jgi:phospholipid/cholesterol/gamma-HCH transport system ATP-binding protein
MAAPALVEFAKVEMAFGPKVVLSDFDLTVERGETLVLLGRSGSGKSVLLKLLLGLMKPRAGAIRYDGTDVVPLGERELGPIRRRIGMVFQGGALFDSMSVADNVAYGLRELLRWPEPRIATRVAECLELVELGGAAPLLPGALSGGMRKRVAIARAVATSPELVLFDEPTTGLDPATAHTVDELVRSLRAHLGITSIVVTHDLDSAFFVADRVALLAHGRVSWLGPVAEAEKLPPAFGELVGRRHDLG